MSADDATFPCIYLLPNVATILWDQVCCNMMPESRSSHAIHLMYAKELANVNHPAAKASSSARFDPYDVRGESRVVHVVLFNLRCGSSLCQHDDNELKE